MALSRWSHSRWYIYNSGDDVLSICMDGSASLDELKEDLNKCVEDIARDESPYDKKELKLYLKYYLNYNTKKIDYSTYIKRLNQLRFLGDMRYYYKYNSFPSAWRFDGFSPKEVVWVETYRKKIEKEKYRFKKEDYELSKPISYMKRLYTQIYSVKFIDDRHFQYRDPKTLEINTVKINKRKHKLAYPDSPILLNYNYKFFPENNIIFNREYKNHKEWKEKKKLLIKDKINKLKKELNSLE